MKTKGGNWLNPGKTQNHTLQKAGSGVTGRCYFFHAKKRRAYQSRNDRGVAASPPRGSALLCILTQPLANGEQVVWRAFFARRLGGFRRRQHANKGCRAVTGWRMMAVRQNLNHRS